MTFNLVIACIDTRNPPVRLRALDGLDVAVHRIIGFGEPDEAQRFRDADAIITEMHPVTGDMLAAFKRCRIVACASTGYDYVDVAAATAHHIWVTNCPGYCTDEVATHTIALLLSQARRLPRVRELARQNEWDPRPVRPLPAVKGQVLGLIGWGRIGKAVAAKALALGFVVLANDPYVDPKLMESAGVLPADKETILRAADYVSLHTPLTPETRGMLDARLLALMKPAAYLINTARGLLIDEAALLEAVQHGRLAGAALDVLPSEPPPADHPFLRDDRFFITPHCAWCSEEADEAVWEWAAGYVASAFRGERPAAAVNEIHE
jgi:D-3-phosphoglycerate dehydrogenase